MSNKLANDKYRAVTRATWISSPADSAILVTAIPTNLPTYIVLGWNTQYETLFEVTSTSGSNSSDYALSGVTVVKGFGATGNLPEGLAVNCLNNEEFFNQYSSSLNSLSGLSGITVDTDGTLAANSDVKVATQKAVKTYVTASIPAAPSNAVVSGRTDTGSDFTTTATSLTDVTGGSVSIVVAATSNVLVTATFNAQNDTDTAYFKLGIKRDTTTLTSNTIDPAHTSTSAATTLTYLDTAVAAGTYAYKMGALAQTGKTTRVLTGSTISAVVLPT